MLIQFLIYDRLLGRNLKVDQVDPGASVFWF
jgi:hypothetical protein